MKHNRILLLLLILTLLLGACSNKKATSKKYYRLNPVTNTTVVASKDQTLVIKRPTALSILGGRPMVATQADGSLVQLSHHFWLESPKVLLQDWLLAWARPMWSQVSTQVPAGQNHQVLFTRILAFEKQQDQAKVKLEFSLYDQNNQLLFNQQLAHQETIQSDGYQGFVKAINQALNAVMTQLAAQLNHVK